MRQAEPDHHPENLSYLLFHNKSDLRSGKRPGFATVTLLALSLLAGIACAAQDTAPFAVTNPRNLKWPAEEASRIYYSACYLAARTVRPEKPPQLRPRFVLVLGTATDETIRKSGMSEIHLQKWDRANFAAAVTMMAAREILSDKDLLNIVRESLLSAQAQVSVSELRQGK
jgi:hypothetical protein